MPTTRIVGAAYSRWWEHGRQQAFGEGYLALVINTYRATNLIYGLLIAYDLITRKHLHGVTFLAVPLLVSSHFPI